MSLINEALKRTRDAAHQAATPRAAGAEPYRISAATPAPIRQKTQLIVWVMLGVLVVIILAAVFALTHLNRTATAVTETLKSPAPIPAPVVPPPVEPVAPNPVPVVVAAVTADPALASVSTLAPVAPPEPPKLTLQGITIDPTTGREALINGVTVRVGEEIDGAKVLAIESRRVVLTFSGHELALRMP